MFNFKNYVNDNQNARHIPEPSPLTVFQFGAGTVMDTNRTYSEYINSREKRKAIAHNEHLFAQGFIPRTVMDAAQIKDSSGRWVLDHDQITTWGRENIPNEMGKDTKLVSEIEEQTREDVKARVGYYEEMYSRASPGGKFAGKVGEFIGDMSEPAYIVPMFAGPARALSVAQFVRSAVLFGALESGAELLTIPQRSRWRTQLGMDLPTSQYAMEVLFAGVFGGTVGAGGLGLIGVGVRKLINAIPTTANKRLKLAKQILLDFAEEVRAAPDKQMDPTAHFDAMAKAIVRAESNLPEGMTLANLGVGTVDSEATVDMAIEALRKKKAEHTESIKEASEELADIESRSGVGEDVDVETKTATELLQTLQARLDEVDTKLMDTIEIDTINAKFRELNMVDSEIRKMENQNVDPQDARYLKLVKAAEKLQSEVSGFAQSRGMDERELVRSMQAQTRRVEMEMLQDLQDRSYELLALNDKFDNALDSTIDYDALELEIELKTGEYEALIKKYQINDIEMLNKRLDSFAFVENMSGNLKVDSYKFRTPLDAAEWIIKFSEDESFVAIAKRFSGDKLISDIKFEVLDAGTVKAKKYFPPDSGALALFTYGGKGGSRIYVRGKGYPKKAGLNWDGRNEGSVVHEMVHASTYYGLSYAISGLPPAKLAAAKTRMTRMRIALETHMVGMSKADKKKHARALHSARIILDDEHEFLTYGLTSVRVQEFFKTIPIEEDPTKTLFSEFVEFMKNIFVLRDHTMFDEVIELSDDLLDVPAYKYDLAGFKGPPKKGDLVLGIGAEEMTNIRERIGKLSGTKAQTTETPTADGELPKVPKTPAGDDDIETFYGGTGDDYGEIMGLKKVEEMIDHDVDVLNGIRGCIDAVT